MAQGIGFKEYNRFIRGFISEATPLNFPEDATIDESNFVLHRSGLRTRRLGMDFEPGYVRQRVFSSQLPMEELATSTFVWVADTIVGPMHILVVQSGTRLNFFNATADAISAAPAANYYIEMLGQPSVVAQYASMYGKLIVANGQRGVMEISVNPVTFAITFSNRLILVRDIWGVDDGRSITERTEVGALTARMEYNLVNQGWGASGAHEPDSPYYRVAATVGPRSQMGVYPSNADLVGAGIDASEDGEFRSVLVEGKIFGNSPSPKGFHIIDAFQRGASRTLAMTGFKLNPRRRVNAQGGPQYNLDFYKTEQSDWPYFNRIHQQPALPIDLSGGEDNLAGGITCTAAYSGRVWYSGASSYAEGTDLRSPSLESYVFFSQVCESPDKMSRCYQENDPTSPDMPDLLDSDGGALHIPDMHRALRLVPLGRSLIVFAVNGIWEISGGETNFSATSFEVRKVSETTPVSMRSIVEVEGTLSFWAEEGIYLLGPDEISGRSSVRNITEENIQTWYANLSRKDKEHCIGVFDPVERKLRWLYGEKKNPPFKLTSLIYPQLYTDSLSVSIDTEEVFLKDTVITTDALPETLEVGVSFRGLSLFGPVEETNELSVEIALQEIKLIGPYTAQPEELNVAIAFLGLQESITYVHPPEEMDVSIALQEIVLS